MGKILSKKNTNVLSNKKINIKILNSRQLHNLFFKYTNYHEYNSRYQTNLYGNGLNFRLLKNSYFSFLNKSSDHIKNLTKYSFKNKAIIAKTINSSLESNITQTTFFTGNHGLFAAQFWSTNEATTYYKSEYYSRYAQYLFYLHLSKALGSYTIFNNKVASEYNHLIVKILVSGHKGKTSICLFLQNLFNLTSIKTLCLNSYSTFFEGYNISSDGKPYAKISNWADTNTTRDTIEKKYHLTLSRSNENDFSVVLRNVINNGVGIIIYELNFSNKYRKKLLLCSPDFILHTNFSVYGFRNHLLESLILIKHVYQKDIIAINTSIFILCRDDDLNRFFFMTRLNNNYISFSSINSNSEVFAAKIVYSIWGTQLLINTDIGNVLLETKLIGKHNLENILQIVCFSMYSRFPISYIQNSVESIENFPERAEKIDFGQAFNLIIDLVDTPENITTLIGSVYESCHVRVLLVAGGSGRLDAEENENFVKLLLGAPKKFFITVNEPKWHNANTIMEEVINGLPSSFVLSHSGSVHDWIHDLKKVPLWFEYWFYKYQDDLDCYIIHDRHLALKLSIAMASKDDVVLITGREKSILTSKSTKTNSIIPTYSNDRDECYKILKRISYLYDIPIKTKSLPWSI